MIKSFSKLPKYLVLGFFSLFVLLPIIYTVTNSFMSPKEINQYYQMATNQKAYIHLIPDNISLESYYQVFLRDTGYLMKFWNSMFITATIVIGQVVLSCLAGYGLAKFQFPFRNVIQFVIIILMMMPYQVTLVSNYIILDQLGLIGSIWAIILPGIFSPFGVFLMQYTIAAIPDEMMQAGYLDGANEFKVMTHIILPQAKGGIASLVILCAIDNWSMVEQPLIFLNDPKKFPLSIFLAENFEQNISLSFACGILAILPMVVLFLFFQNELTDGIQFTGLK